MSVELPEKYRIVFLKVMNRPESERKVAGGESPESEPRVAGGESPEGLRKVAGGD